MNEDNISIENLVHSQLKEIIEQQQAKIDRLQDALDNQESSVPLTQYEAVIRKLEDEQMSHAATTQRLMQCQDQLDFAHGEIESLKKQIHREKKQFESTFGMLKTRALKDTVKAVELENKCHAISSQCEEQEGHLSNKDEKIKQLSEKLKCTTQSYDQQLSELNIRLQQEVYIAKVMEDRDRKTGKKS